MIRLAHSLLRAAVVVGVIIPATVGLAANPYAANAGYPSATSANPSGSQLTLVSATEDQPQAANPSPMRLIDPRTDIVPADQPIVPATPKPTAPQSSVSQTAKPVASAPRPATAAAKQPAPRTTANVQPLPAKAIPKQPTPNYYPHNGVRLTANVVVEPRRQETVIRPAPALSAAPAPIMDPQTSMDTPMSMDTPPSPEMEAGIGECPTCSSCCDSCCGFCAGMEYLLLRPHFGDNEAFQQMTATTTPTTVTDINQTINFAEPYNSDYHFFVGYRTACGDEFRLGYWHIADGGNRSGTASGDFLAGAGTAFQGPDTTELTAAGETINATTHTTLNMYDLDDVKRLDLPSLGCDCCPTWDVHWSYGLRVIDFRRTVDDFTPFETVNNEAEFTGAGPKLGLEVRRQIGHTKLSAYVSATAALLLGEQRSRSSSATPGVLQTAVATDQIHGDMIVPDFNLSVGVEWHPWCRTTFTGGWLFEDFGGLGGSTCIICNSPTGTISSGDLSFDGLFIRAEHCF